jgi:hypothetical protein
MGPNLTTLVATHPPLNEEDAQKARTLGITLEDQLILGQLGQSTSDTLTLLKAGVGGKEQILLKSNDIPLEQTLPAIEASLTPLDLVNINEQNGDPLLIIAELLTDYTLTRETVLAKHSIQGQKLIESPGNENWDKAASKLASKMKRDLAIWVTALNAGDTSTFNQEAAKHERNLQELTVDGLPKNTGQLAALTSSVTSLSLMYQASAVLGQKDAGKHIRGLLDQTLKSDLIQATSLAPALIHDDLREANRQEALNLIRQLQEGTISQEQETEALTTLGKRLLLESHTQAAEETLEHHPSINIKRGLNQNLTTISH